MTSYNSCFTHYTSQSRTFPTYIQMHYWFYTGQNSWPNNAWTFYRWVCDVTGETQVPVQLSMLWPWWRVRRHHELEGSTTEKEDNIIMHRPVCQSAMGSPLSPIVANLHMEAFKEKALSAQHSNQRCGSATWIWHIPHQARWCRGSQNLPQSPQRTTPSDLVHYGGRVGRTNTFPRHSGG